MTDKTEQPTRKRLRDARKKGQVLHSREVTTAVGYFVLIMAMITMLPWVWKRLQRLFEFVWSSTVMRGGPETWPHIMSAIVQELADLALPITLIAAAAAAVAAAAQTRGVFSMDPILPDLQRINPGEGFKRIFSTQSLFNLIKLLIKFVLMSATIAWVIQHSTNAIMRLMYGVPIEAAQAGADLLLMLFGAVGALYLAFAAIDFVHQFYEFMKKMRMSKEDIRRERKDTDGNPLIKSARRRLARELASSSPGDATRRASVLVVNPTHFAVALFYEPGITDLPVVVEKAVDEQAAFLRKVAGDASVPIFEYPLLARELFSTTAVASHVPQQLLPAVAEVIVWAQRAGSGVSIGP